MELRFKLYYTPKNAVLSSFLVRQAHHKSRAPQTTIKKPIGIHGFFGNRGKGVCGALLAFRPLRGLPCLLKTELAAFFGARIAREISQMFQCFAMFRIYFQ